MRKIFVRQTLQKVTEMACSLDDLDSLNFMLLGKPGIGKSSLVNGLIGAKVADTGDILGEIAKQGITRNITSYEGKIEDTNITIWDTPGLLDPSFKDYDVFAEISQASSKVDLFLYCIKMSEARFLPGNDDEKIIQMLTKTLGEDIWERTLVVLVHANTAVAEFELDCDTDEELNEAFQRRLQQWQELLREATKAAVDMVPAGHKKRKYIIKTDELPWLSTFWMKTFETIPNDIAKAALLKISEKRLVVNDGEISRKEESSTTTPLHDQNIPLPPTFLQKLKEVATKFASHFKNLLRKLFFF